MFFFLMAACSPDSRTAESTPGNSPKDVPADGRPIILAFGDSLTAGSGLPAGEGYPELLQKELDGRGYRYRVVNEGIGGDTTGGGLARLANAVRLRPRIVILELGANDGLQGIPVDSMKSNLDELITAFQKSGATVLLAGMTLPLNFGPDYIAAFEMVYPALAQKHKAALIPFFLEGAAARPELNLEDGIHPNAAGYRVVTANVLKYLEPLLRK